jgi:hypothetical protein
MLAPPAEAGPARVTLDDAGFTLALANETRMAAYRDLDTIAVQDGAALVVLGSGAGAERVLLDLFGRAQGQLVRELRERRLRQRAADALMTLPPDEAIAMVEYEAGAQHGVGQLAYHAWGALLAPLDDRLPWVLLRRSRIAAVQPNDAGGSVEVELAIRPGDANGALGGGHVRFVGLGAAARLHADRLEALRTGALADAARIIGALIPDAPYAARQEAAGVLVDGRPARPGDLPTSWSAIESGVMVDPTFASSYAQLRARAGPLAEERALAMAPTEPGGDEARSWFLVPLPGNLLALELVSEGAHATYCFRVGSRAAFVAGADDPAAAAAAVRTVSEALVDSRFLREPMALTDDALARPRYLRYRLALGALPSLAAARARFVARIVHRDDASWAAALDDLIAWHASTRDDGAVWPGRAAQDAMVDDASGDEPDAPHAGQPDAPLPNTQGAP